MNLLDVYNKIPLEPKTSKGSWVTDITGIEYLDFYGGHGVISIGHQHPNWKKALSEQMDKISFYSNAVNIPIQEEAAKALKEVSGLEDYEVFFCNSGAEANENALKLAAWQQNRKKIVALKNAFHGRSLAALQATDNANILSPLGSFENTEFVDINDLEGIKKALNNDVAAFIVEGIQGVAGVIEPQEDFLLLAQELCAKHDICLIMDEVQSGAGRSGKFFAFQHYPIQPNIITVAKGLGNGFPVAAVLCKKGLTYKKGMLGTTFGGNHLACAAVKAVCETIAEANFLKNAQIQGEKLKKSLTSLSAIAELRGKGLMLGIALKSGDASSAIAELQKRRIITGSAACKDTLRILPPLSISDEELEFFIQAITQALKQTA